jgi:3-deoxy-D-manno-octulosonate 8-phosphate phosphatase KdsC-like HAD superfamily phosphatase
MLYVGDDIFDINLLKKVGLSVCPSDASPEVLKTCDLILENKGGENVIVELVEYLEKNNLVDKYNYEHILNIDADEKF